MELSLTNGLKRLQQPTRMEKKENAEIQTKAVSMGRQSHLDQVALSKEAVAYIMEQHRQNMERIQQETEKGVAGLGETEEDAELDILGEQLKTTQKCMEIATRIMRGDKVPPQDEAYLMQNDPEGYKLALAMRRPKKDPKEWESILDEEEQDVSGEERGEGEAVAAVSGSSGGEAGSAASGEA